MPTRQIPHGDGSFLVLVLFSDKHMLCFRCPLSIQTQQSTWPSHRVHYYNWISSQHQPQINATYVNYTYTYTVNLFSFTEMMSVSEWPLFTNSSTHNHCLVGALLVHQLNFSGAYGAVFMQSKFTKSTDSITLTAWPINICMLASMSSNWKQWNKRTGSYQLS